MGSLDPLVTFGVLLSVGFLWGGEEGPLSTHHLEFDASSALTAG